MSKKIYVTFIAEGKTDGFPSQDNIDDDDAYILAISDIYNTGIGRFVVFDIIHSLYNADTVNSLDWDIINISNRDIEDKNYRKTIIKILKFLSREIIDNNTELHINNKYSSHEMRLVVIAIGMYMKYLFPELNLIINNKTHRMERSNIESVFNGISKDDIINILAKEIKIQK